MLINTKKLILFDFDGTLVDTSEDVMNAVNHMRNYFGAESLSLSKIITLIGKGQRQTIIDATKDIENIDIDFAEKIYTGYYKEHIGEKSYLFDGVVNFLINIKNMDKKLAIISNKYSYFIEGTLNAINCPVKFDLIFGPDVLNAKKPDPIFISEAVKYFNLQIDDALFIGDSDIDLQTGKNSGITTVIVSYGFNENKDMFLNQGPDYLVDSMMEILKL